MTMKVCKRKIASLHGLLEVERTEQPPVILFALQPQRMGDRLEIRMEAFIRFDALPEAVREQVREVTDDCSRAEMMEGMHADTLAEMTIGDQEGEK
jgi:hypothetical protein